MNGPATNQRYATRLGRPAAWADLRCGVHGDAFRSLWSTVGTGVIRHPVTKRLRCPPFSMPAKLRIPYDPGRRFGLVRMSAARQVKFRYRGTAVGVGALRDFTDFL